MTSEDFDHLTMLYPAFVDAAMRSEEPVTWEYHFTENRVIYKAAQYDPDAEVVWRADIEDNRNPEYESTPSVSFHKCYPTSRAEIMQSWSPLATGRLSGPKELPAWEALFTVFNAALQAYHGEIDVDRQTERGDGDAT